MEDYAIWSIIVSAIGTAVIAGFAVTNYLLARAIKTKDEQHQQELSDLYQAIILSNLTSPRDQIGQKINFIGEHYTGKTTIIKGSIPSDKG